MCVCVSVCKREGEGFIVGKRERENIQRLLEEFKAERKRRKLDMTRAIFINISENSRNRGKPYLGGGKPVNCSRLGTNNLEKEWREVRRARRQTRTLK